MTPESASGAPTDGARADTSEAETPDAQSASGKASQPSDPGRVLLDSTGIERSLTRIAHEIIERTEEPERLYLVAIPNGGVPLARHLAANLKQIADLSIPVGVLDTTLYRDDLLTTGARPALRRTEMPSAVDDHVVILVDDVVKTGRTIRAAMDALMDFGRPKSVQVVGLVDRGHRELPIKLDYVGKNIPTNPDEDVQLLGTGGDSDGRLEIVVVSEGRETRRSAMGGEA